MKKANKKRLLIFITWVFFALYVVYVIYSTLLNRVNYYMSGINMMPFKSYVSAFKDQDMHVWFNLVANIIIFVPFGYFLPILFYKYKPFVKTLSTCILISIAIELTQYRFHLGMLDIDDLINNTVGSLIGLLAIIIVKKL